MGPVMDQPCWSCCSTAARAVLAGRHIGSFVTLLGGGGGGSGCLILLFIRGWHSRLFCAFALTASMAEMKTRRKTPKKLRIAKNAKANKMSIHGILRQGSEAGTAESPTPGLTASQRVGKRGRRVKMSHLLFNPSFLKVFMGGVAGRRQRYS